MLENASDRTDQIMIPMYGRARQLSMRSRPSRLERGSARHARSGSAWRSRANAGGSHKYQRKVIMRRQYRPAERSAWAMPFRRLYGHGHPGIGGTQENYYMVHKKAGGTHYPDLLAIGRFSAIVAACPEATACCGSNGPFRQLFRRRRVPAPRRSAPRRWPCRQMGVSTPGRWRWPTRYESLRIPPWPRRARSWRPWKKPRRTAWCNDPPRAS